MKETDLIPSAPPKPPESVGTFPVPPLQFNPDDYREELAAFDLTEAQENELLAVLWNIMASFVAMGFGLDSVQLFSTAECEDPAEKIGGDSGNSVVIKSTPKQFNQAAINGGSKED
jgi:hypothetical protein